MNPEKESVIRPKGADLDAETRRRFEEALAKLDEDFKPWTDSIRESERLSEDDFAIRINARD